MKQVRLWFQKYIAGRLRSPQAIHRTALAELNDGGAVASDRFFDMPPDGLGSAPKRLSAPDFFFTDSLLRQYDRADWFGADPRLMYWAALVIELARKRSIPLYVHSCYRSEAEQTRLLRERRSKVAWPYSAHNSSQAVDLVHGVFHWDMTPDEWQFISALGGVARDRVNSLLPADRKLYLNWGGPDTAEDDFAWDPAHWEIDSYDPFPLLPHGEPVRLTPRHILRHCPPK